ncbi:MAG: outer membrane beta-barrel protein, partial [Alphaproteobacteria bacterium]
PIGIVVGPRDSFLLYPKLKVEVEHTDNLFKTENNEVSDQILLLSPSFDIRSNWESHALILRGLATQALHNETTVENWIDYRLELDGRFEVLDTGRLAGFLSVKRGHEDRGSPDDPALVEPAVFHVGTLKLSGAYKADVILLQLNLTTRRPDFRDSENDDRDRIEFEARGRAGYEWVPGSTAFIEGALDVRDFDEEIDDSGFMRSSDGFEVLAGNTLDLSGVTFAELGVGYREQRFDDPRLDTAAGFSFSGSLIWNATDLLTITGHLRRIVRETTVPGASSALTSAFSLTADYELLDNLILDAQVDFELEEFEGIGRDDELLRFGLGGRYLIGTNLYAGARYRFEDRTSDEVGDSFTVNSFRVFVTTQL